MLQYRFFCLKNHKNWNYSTQHIFHYYIVYKAIFPFPSFFIILRHAERISQEKVKRMRDDDNDFDELPPKGCNNDHYSTAAVTTKQKGPFFIAQAHQLGSLFYTSRKWYSVRTASLITQSIGLSHWRTFYYIYHTTHAPIPSWAINLSFYYSSAAKHNILKLLLHFPVCFQRILF